MVLTSVIFSGLSFFAAAGLSSATALARGETPGPPSSHGSEAAPPIVVSRSTSRRFMAGPFVKAQAKVCMIRRGAANVNDLQGVIALGRLACGRDVNLAALEERLDQPGDGLAVEVA